MKVAWICNFSNAEIQSIVHPGLISNEYAPWITQLAKLFESEMDIELHIISPHEDILGYKHLNLRNIQYHFFNPKIKFRRWSLLDLFDFNLRLGYIYNKYVIRTFINKIKPDIIHLHGAENAYYSSSIFQFKNNYPVFITIQGFISHSAEIGNYNTKKRIEIETRILKTFNHFGYRTHQMAEDIRVFNPEAILHWHHYPIAKPEPIETAKVYDIVFFARLCRDKGIEDLLEVISLIKKDNPDIRACIIGGNFDKYLTYLKNKASQLGILHNVDWTGHLPTQKDVHKMASKAKLCVLPTYHDIISGTIIESLFLKLPVVAYNVGSIHEVNDNCDIISLVPKGDIISLAKEIMRLLLNPEILNFKSEKGYSRALEMFDNSLIVNDLIESYKSVIHEFGRNNGTI